MKLVNRKKRVVIIIQARMGSMRFPGKMMALLNDIPLIEWVIERTKQSKTADVVVLSTSTLECDDVLANKAISLGIDVVRGEEVDVLGRFSIAAQQHNADVVVRVCGDRPLIDPSLLDLAVTTYQSENVDLVYNHISGNGQWWPRGFGVEVFNAKKLHWMNKNLEASNDREHVTPHIWNKNNSYKVMAVECPKSINPDIEDLRFDVDEIEDLAFLSQICRGKGVGISASQVIESWKKAGSPIRVAK